MSIQIIEATEEREGPMGWGEEGLTVQQNLENEERYYDRAADNMPIAYRAREEVQVLPEIQKKWDEFQKQKGYGEGSFDLTTLDEFVLGELLDFPPQIIGSCVLSNTITGVKRRQLAEIAFYGQAEEYFGLKKNTIKAIAPYAPFSYGAARVRGNMARGGDGLYCQVAAESMLTDGFVLCSDPALNEILKARGATADSDYPEPQDARLYRDFGAGKYISELKKSADFRLLESSKIKDIDDIIAASKAMKPIFQCSGIAIKKVGTHKDGFTIHARNPFSTWSHNMGIHGFFIASDGELYIRVSNESWGKGMIYNVKASEVASWYEQRRCDAMTVGELDLPKSVPLFKRAA